MAGTVIADDRTLLISTPIKTGATQQICKRLGGYRGYVEHFTRGRWPMLMRRLKIDWMNPQGEVKAEVVRGSWRASCPYCDGAMFVEPSEPFFCCDCAMQGNGFKPMRVIWPENRQAIEELLRKRPDPNTRNWIPPETIDNLAAENAAHGV